MILSREGHIHRSDIIYTEVTFRNIYAYTDKYIHAITNVYTDKYIHVIITKAINLKESREGSMERFGREERGEIMQL